MSIHSLPGQPRPEPYELRVRAARPRLRPYVLGWAGFRTPATAGQPTRMLPLNAATLIVDFTGAGAFVTGPRSAATLVPQALWRHGVAVGLTPAGMAALTGTPMSEVAGAAAVPLEDLLGARQSGELAGRLAEQAGWAERFALLERWLATRLRPAGPDDLIMRAWRRLQQPPDARRLQEPPDARTREPGGRVTVEGVAAELGVSRRYLELGFRRAVGLSPKTVARVARFQRAVRALSRPAAALDEAALACGYADQPHLTREVRAMAGMTPGQLFAFVQDTGAAAH
ncbi:helix-turn-helix transcriptional regulator [[Actinomadura] parvosata]|uniref:helix-turn-helix transcriptional regulator n=1 Tax=[Actinomadura] parvosata TaxID=1955412 RepID=UPI00406CA545